MQNKMTEGKVIRALAAFTVPLTLSGLFQQLFNWVDAFIVGNVEGETALAGIGATTSVYNLFVTVITGFTSVQSGVSSVGNIYLQQFMNRFGEQTVAAITTAYRVDTVIFLPIINFGSGIATVVAQNIGAGKPERAKQVFRAGTVIMTVISLALTALVLLLGEKLIAAFGITPDTAAIGREFFHSIARFYIIYGISMAVRGCLEGRGDMLFSGIAGILSLGVRILCSYAFKPVFGNMVVAYAEAFSWIFLLAVLLLRYAVKTRHTFRYP